jgi:AcrR family transcriptional regulator
MRPESQAVPGGKNSKRDRTRASLVEAAAQLVAEQGFERTSLEQVANRAGMTRGAIYGNFKNKEDLFLAVVATKWQPILPPLQAGASFAEQVDILAEAVVAAMPSRRRAAIAAASFQLYALTHEPMRARIAHANEEIYRRMAVGLHQFGAETDLGMPPELFVKVAHALIDGLMFLHALTPGLIDADVIRAAIKAVARKNESAT